MLKNANTIKFYLLCHLKELESTEHHIHSSNIINKTLRIQVSYLDSLSLVPTTSLHILGHSLSHGMGKGLTINPKVALTGLPASDCGPKLLVMC